MTGVSLSVADLAIDHTVAQTAASMQFLLDVTPTNADEQFAHGRVGEPEFTYRPLEVAPEVLSATTRPRNVQRRAWANSAAVTFAPPRCEARYAPRASTRHTPDFSAYAARCAAWTGREGMDCTKLCENYGRHL